MQVGPDQDQPVARINGLRRGRGHLDQVKRRCQPPERGRQLPGEPRRAGRHARERTGRGQVAACGRTAAPQDRADCGNADDSRLPAHSGADEESVFLGQILQHFYKLGLQTFGHGSNRLVEQSLEWGSLQSKHAVVGKDLLLTDSKSQRR